MKVKVLLLKCWGKSITPPWSAGNAEGKCLGWKGKAQEA